MTRRAGVTLAAVALGAGVFVSSLATGAPPQACSKKSCAEEVSSACGAFTGMAASTCTKNLLAQCNAGLCTCTGQPGLPNCPVTTTTTTSSTTTTTTLVTTCTDELLLAPCVCGAGSGTCLAICNTGCSQVECVDGGGGTCIDDSTCPAGQRCVGLGCAQTPMGPFCGFSPTNPGRCALPCP
jgi:hypothetical protein